MIDIGERLQQLKDERGLNMYFPGKAIRFVMEYNQEFLLPPVKADCNNDIYAL